VTQPIHPDRLTPPIADRDRSKATPAAPSPATTSDANSAAPSIDTADISQGSALLRTTAPARGSGTIANADQAHALAVRVAGALSGDPARALQAYAATSREDVQALLATA
jgi:hypothetical protein